MKKIILMRHGKSSWKNNRLSDHERPLKKRGREEAKLMAEYLTQKTLVPQMILVSSAERTRQTLEIVNQVLNLPEKSIHFFDQLYLPEQDEIMEILNDLDNSWDTAMLIGHNPSLELCIHNLTGKAVEMPTAAVALIEMNITNWQDLTADRKSSELAGFWKPKEVEI